jgi:hypothetical protein
MQLDNDMDRLLISAYEEKESWEMNAVALDGNVYLEDNVPIERRRQRYVTSRT